MNKFFKIFQYELLHFARSPFKIITLMIFFLAMIYGCQNGLELYKKQMKEIDSIKEKNKYRLVDEDISDDHAITQRYHGVCG